MLAAHGACRRLLLGGKGVQEPRAEPPGDDCRGVCRLAHGGRHGVVGVLRRPGPATHHRAYAREQQGHARRRRPRRAVPSALPREEGRAAALRQRAGLRQPRDERILRPALQQRPRNRSEGLGELGARHVGQPALGQAQGRSRIHGFGRGRAGDAHDARGRGRIGLLQPGGARQRACHRAADAPHPQRGGQAGEAAFRGRSDLGDGLPAGQGGVRLDGVAHPGPGAPHRNHREQHLAAHGRISRLGGGPQRYGYRGGALRYDSGGASLGAAQAASRRALLGAGAACGDGCRGRGLCRPLPAADADPYGRCRGRILRTPLRGPLHLYGGIALGAVVRLWAQEGALPCGGGGLRPGAAGL